MPSTVPPRVIVASPAPIVVSELRVRGSLMAMLPLFVVILLESSVVPEASVLKPVNAVLPPIVPLTVVALLELRVKLELPSTVPTRVIAKGPAFRVEFPVSVTASFNVIGPLLVVILPASTVVPPESVVKLVKLLVVPMAPPRVVVLVELRLRL